MRRCGALHALCACRGRGGFPLHCSTGRQTSCGVSMHERRRVLTPAAVSGRDAPFAFVQARKACSTSSVLLRSDVQGASCATLRRDCRCRRPPELCIKNLKHGVRALRCSRRRCIAGADILLTDTALLALCGRKGGKHGRTSTYERHNCWPCRLVLPGVVASQRVWHAASLRIRARATWCTDRARTHTHLRHVAYCVLLCVEGWLQAHGYCGSAPAAGPTPCSGRALL